jgi:hypothetical protein
MGLQVGYLLTNLLGRWHFSNSYRIGAPSMMMSEPLPLTLQGLGAHISGTQTLMLSRKSIH